MRRLVYDYFPIERHFTLKLFLKICNAMYVKEVVNTRLVLTGRHHVNGVVESGPRVQFRDAAAEHPGPVDATEVVCVL